MAKIGSMTAQDAMDASNAHWGVESELRDLLKDVPLDKKKKVVQVIKDYLAEEKSEK